jgi:cell division protein ZapA (FtsZ GTPase activity inhibitor)
MDKVSVNIVIAGRPYPMKVDAENEKSMRDAERLIRTEMSNLSRYGNQDIQAKLSVTLLTIATQLINCQEQSNVHCAEIERIDHKLGIYLEEQGSLDNIE